MKAQEFDKKFDDGAVDIVQDLDMTTARRPNQRQRRVNVDFPMWMVAALDKEAARIGVTRQSITKLWLAERLEQAAHKAGSSDDRFDMSQAQMNEATTKDIADHNAAADRMASILAQTKPASEDAGRSEDEIMQNTLADIAEARKERRNPQT